MGLEIKPGSNGIWRISGTVAGRRIRKSAKTRDFRAAKLAAQTIERKLWQGLADGKAETVTFEVAANSYMDSDKDTRFLVPLIEHFAGVAIGKIRGGHIEDAARQIYPGAKPATWNRQVLTPVQAIINHAAERGWCPPIRVRRFKEKRAERVAVTREWLDAFMAHAEPEVAALGLFMFTTGARITEALSLRWSGIDGRSARFMTKTGPREAILSRELMLRLTSLPRTNDRVFRFAWRTSIYKRWYRACAAAAIAPVPPHQAGRHSFATEMIVRRGVDPKTTAALGGWKSPRLLMDCYTHPENLTEVIDEVFAAPVPRKARDGGVGS